MTLNDYWELCLLHDWTYEYSDDHAKWVTGNSNANRLKALAASGGPEYQKMYSGFHRAAFGQEARPLRPGYDLVVTPPKVLTDFTEFFMPSDIGERPCGVFLASREETLEVFPELRPTLDQAPISDWSNWVVDVKVHMLMQGQYPCIPGWHTDMVPRDKRGQLDYKQVKQDGSYPIMLWVSNGPLTEYLSQPMGVTHNDLKTHRALGMAIRKCRIPAYSPPAQHWIGMDQTTPHRGTMASNKGWRVFIRLLHKSIAPTNPTQSVIRRHCQVYLNAGDFSW